MLNFAICDDDFEFCKTLEKYLNEYFSRKKLKAPDISVFHSGEELLTSGKTFDIAFLDVEMSGLSGIYTGKELKEKNPHMLFFIITSHQHYLDEALHFQAFRYLTKPLDKYRLFRNLEDAIQLYTTSITKIAIETKDGVYTVLSPEIIMVEARAGNVIIYTTNGEYRTKTKINEWESRLPKACFFRSHKSFIVNFKHVCSFDNSLIYMYDNKYKAYLTIRRYTQFKHEYFVFLEHIGC